MPNLVAFTTTNLNVRQQGKNDGAVLQELPQGAQVTVLGNAGAWLYVQSGDQSGFAYSDFLAQQPAASGTAWTTTVLSDELNVRDAPSPDGNKIGALTRGQQADIQGYIGTWLLALSNGQIGFIKADYTQSVLPDSGQPFDASQIAAFIAASQPVGIAINDQNQPVVAPAPQPSNDLMSKARLSPEEIRIVREQIRQLDDENAKGDRYEDLQSRVVYASQRDNQARYGNGAKVESKSGNMCNLTSLSMVLSYLGISNPNPQMQYEDALETLRQQRGLAERITSEGWGGVAHALGVDFRMIASGQTGGYDWWNTTVRQPWMRRGCGVMMSIGGHIVRVQAVTPAGLIVDDPYGHCRLLPGEQNAWKYDRVNQYEASGQTAGEDSLWAWDDVSRHTMRWIAAFMPSDGVLSDEDIPHVEDDGVVIEGIEV